MEARRHLPAFQTCKTCSYRTRFVFMLERHNMRQHCTSLKTDVFICDSYAPEVYQCEFCDFQSDLKVISAHHLKTVHKEEVSFSIDSVKEHRCDECGFKTYSQLILLDHHNSAESNCWNTPVEINRQPEQYISNKNNEQEKKRWSYCEHCSYKSKKAGNLKRHITRNHATIDDIQWFSCEVCSFKSKKKQNFKKHLLIHAEPENVRWFYCAHCPYQAKRKEHLNYHNMNKHTKDEDICWFHCEQCPYKAKMKKNLKEHQARKHTKSEDIQWFSCEFCSYKSKKKTSLLLHLNNVHAINMQIFNNFAPQTSQN